MCFVLFVQKKYIYILHVILYNACDGSEGHDKEESLFLWLKGPHDERKRKGVKVHYEP